MRSSTSCAKPSLAVVAMVLRESCEQVSYQEVYTGLRASSYSKLFIINMLVGLVLTQIVLVPRSGKLVPVYFHEVANYCCIVDVARRLDRVVPCRGSGKTPNLVSGILWKQPTQSCLFPSRSHRRFRSRSPVKSFESISN